MSEIYIREELDRIKSSSLLSYIGSSAVVMKEDYSNYFWNFQKIIQKTHLK